MDTNIKYVWIPEELHCRREVGDILDSYTWPGLFLVTLLSLAVQCNNPTFDTHHRRILGEKKGQYLP